MTATMPGVTPGTRQPDGSRTPSSTLQSWARAPFFALQFLTIVPPVIVRRSPQADDLGRSEAFFPLVGLGLGGLLVALDLLLQPFVGERVRDVVLIATLAALTGALHLDGVIDTCDGLFGGHSRARRLELMRDPRAGAYGVVAVTLVLALKLAALASLPQAIRPAALVLAPCLGRWGIVLATATFPYARPEGMGRDFKESIRWTHLVVASLIALGAAGLVAGAGGFVIWVAVGAMVLLVGRWMTAALGGLTGDTYGTICELVEAGTLVALGLHIGGMAG